MRPRLPVCALAVWAVAGCSVTVGNADAGTLRGDSAFAVAYVGFAQATADGGGAILVIDLSDQDYSATCGQPPDGGVTQGSQDLVIDIYAPSGTLSAGTFAINPDPNQSVYAPNLGDGGATAETVIANPGSAATVSTVAVSGTVTLSEISAQHVVGTLQVEMSEGLSPDAGIPRLLSGGFDATPCAIVGAEAQP